MPVRVVAVNCPSCKRPVEQEYLDTVFYCPCGYLHTRDDEGIHAIRYDIAAPDPRAVASSRVVYAPFWRLDSHVTVHHERSKGGFFRRLFGRDWKGGRIFIFIPAVEWGLGEFKRWASALTRNPPRYRQAKGFGHHGRLPVSLSAEEAEHLADFLVMVIEVDKPGTLQELDFSMRFNDAVLTYLPMVRSGRGYELAI